MEMFHDPRPGTPCVGREADADCPGDDSIVRDHCADLRADLDGLDDDLRATRDRVELDILSAEADLFDL